MKTTKHFILFVLSILIFSSCVKEDFENVDVSNDSNDFRDLSVPEGFQYQTNKTVSIDIKMPNSIDFNKYRSRFDIYSDTLGEHLLSGSFDKAGHFNDEITVPVTLDRLYFKSRVTDSLIPLSLTYMDRENVTVDLREFYEMGADAFPIEEKHSFKNYVNKSNNNALINGNFSIDDFGIVDALGKFTPGIEKWSFVEKPKFEKMTYYFEDGDGFIGTSDEGQHDFSVVQTIAVSPGDLIDFSAMAKSINHQNINCVYRLIARSDGGRIEGLARMRLGRPPYEWTTTNILMTMPEKTTYLTLEAVGTDRTETGRIVLDNFSVSGITDSDNDGVEDEYDDYPDDANKAYNYYYPSNASYGSFLYEDSWPARGDYDFNDLVVDYQFKQVFNADNDIVEMEVDFKFRAIGASYKNGFGFQMDINPDLIESVTGTSLTENIISLQSNGTEAGHNKATIIVTDNAFNVLPHPGDGTGVNTVSGLTYVQPKSVVMNIKFTEPVSTADLGPMPYNPFMFINGDRGKEIHLPGYAPTDKADRSNFGTNEDDTNIALGKYYLTKKNLPWAISIPVSFEYPVEGKSIDKAYYHFAQWAQSRGFSYMDWYLSHPGYKSGQNIY